MTTTFDTYHFPPETRKTTIAEIAQAVSAVIKARRQRRKDKLALNRLDDRVLRDIGIDPRDVRETFRIEPVVVFRNVC